MTEALRLRNRKECADAIKAVVEALRENRTIWAAAEAVCREAAQEAGFEDELWREPLEAAEAERAQREAQQAVAAEWERFLVGAGKALTAGVSLAVLEVKTDDERWMLEPGQLRRELEARGLFISPEIQPEREVEGLAQPDEEAEGQSKEEDCTEDGDNPANDIRRRLWKVQGALKWIEPDGEIPERVGGVLWRLSRENRQAGREIWVEWYARTDHERTGTAQRLWDAGFEGVAWCSVEVLYAVAQRKGWRFPVAQNLNKLEEMTGRVEAALVRVGADIYQAGNRLVRPVRSEVYATKGRKTKIASLVSVDPPFLKTELTRCVDFFEWRKEERVGKAPPGDVVSAMLSRFGKWEFPSVTGVITVPTLRRDGTVLACEGLDKETGLLVVGPLPDMPAVNPRPGREEAERAVRILDGLLDGFPFVDRCSRAAALSGFISPVVRGALTCVPLHGVTAPIAGTGKSFLWDLIGGIVIGDAMPIIAAGANLEEMEKRLDALLIAGLTMFSLDNVSMPIGGDALCQAIERPLYSARMLGKSEVRDRRNTWGLYATGNNLRLRDDVTRRALLIRLDAGVERPELREFSDNPFDRVLGNRGLYIWAALTVVLGYRTAGMPGRLPHIGDPFAEWSDLVRSALVWLDYADPVETMEAARDNDPSRQARAAMVQAMLTPMALESLPRGLRRRWFTMQSMG
jgi:hypothetical protein